MSFTKKQLLPGENLVVLARQHPLVMSKAILLNVLALVLLGGLSIVTQQALFMAVYLAPLAYFFWEFLAWHQRQYILTDHRVVKQEGVFTVSSFDASLDKINNVYHRQSLMGRLLNYGEVGLETASEQGNTTFAFLSKPVAFKNCIVRQRELYRADMRSTPAATTPSVTQLLEELASLRDRNVLTAAEFEEKKKSLLGKI